MVQTRNTIQLKSPVETSAQRIDLRVASLRSDFRGALLPRAVSSQDRVGHSLTSAVTNVQ